MDVTDPAIATAPTAPEVAHIRALLREHKFAAVLAAAEGLQPDSPRGRDALLCVAVAQRYLHHIAEALQTLATLERHHPRFSRLYEERGHCYVALRKAPAGDRGLPERGEHQPGAAGAAGACSRGCIA